MLIALFKKLKLLVELDKVSKHCVNRLFLGGGRIHNYTVLFAFKDYRMAYALNLNASCSAMKGNGTHQYIEIGFRIQCLFSSEVKCSSHSFSIT